jgi:hypothetical protein
LLDTLIVLPLDPPADAHYAALRATPERAGTPIGSHDLFIAAHARSREVGADAPNGLLAGDVAANIGDDFARVNLRSRRRAADTGSARQDQRHSKLPACSGSPCPL